MPEAPETERIVSCLSLAITLLHIGSLLDNFVEIEHQSIGPNMLPCHVLLGLAVARTVCQLARPDQPQRIHQLEAFRLLRRWPGYRALLFDHEGILCVHHVNILVLDHVNIPRFHHAHNLLLGCVKPKPKPAHTMLRDCRCSILQGDFVEKLGHDIDGCRVVRCSSHGWRRLPLSLSIALHRILLAISHQRNSRFLSRHVLREALKLCVR